MNLRRSNREKTGNHGSLENRYFILNHANANKASVITDRLIISPLTFPKPAPDWVILPNALRYGVTANIFEKYCRGTGSAYEGNT